MAAPLVDIIIPCYNMARYLPQAIDSALAQSYRPIRVVVVDDGSQEDVAAVVRSYGGAVEYLRQENSGPSAARNNGLRHTSGEYVCFVDADDVILPCKTAAQVAYLQAHPEVDLVHGQSMLFDGDDITHPYAEWRPHLPWDDYLAPLAIFCPFAIHAVTMRRELVLTSGGFGEDLRGECEDWAYWFRCLSTGGVFAFVPGVVALYRQHRQSTSFDAMAFARRETKWMQLLLQSCLEQGLLKDPNKAHLSCGARFAATRLLKCGLSTEFAALMRQAEATGLTAGADRMTRMPGRPSPLNYLDLAGDLCGVGSPDLAAFVLLFAGDFRLLRRMAYRSGAREGFDAVVACLKRHLGRFPEGAAQEHRLPAPDPGDLGALEAALKGGTSHLSYIQHQLGLCAGDAGDYAEAVDRLRCALSLNPFFRPFYEDLARTLVRAGRSQEAPAVLERLRSIDPDSGFASYCRAKYLLKKGRLVAGGRELSRAWAAGSVPILKYLLNDLDPLLVPRLGALLGK